MTGGTFSDSAIEVSDVQENVEIDNTEKTISATLKYLGEELIEGYHHYLVLWINGAAENATVTLANTNEIPSTGFT